MTALLRRMRAESSQAWAITVKDIKVYYLTPPMIMLGLLMPFFMFFSFSVKREMPPGASLARLLALITFFTASSAGPVIIPLERRTGTLDRLLAAPLSTTTLLVAKSLVGIIFGIGVAMLALLASMLIIESTPKTVRYLSLRWYCLLVLFLPWDYSSLLIQHNRRALS